MITYATDPTVTDTDEDGLSDEDEVVVYDTDPTVVDTDGDGISDAAELEAGTDPLDPLDPRIETTSVPEFGFREGLGILVIMALVILRKRQRS